MCAYFYSFVCKHIGFISLCVRLVRQGRASREEEGEVGDGQHLAVPEVRAQGEIEALSRLLGDEWGGDEGVRGEAAFILL